MHIRLWLYSKTKNTARINDSINFKEEEIVDITIKPYGDTFFYCFPIASQLSIRIGRRDSPPSLIFVRKSNSASRLPEGGTLEVRKNGIVCAEPKDSLMEEYPIAVKDHIEITVTDGYVVETIHVLVISISSNKPQAPPPDD